jgi:uncharacterized Tic20 family protein
LKKYPIASLTAIGVFIILMLCLFLPKNGEMNSTGIMICLGYAVICFLFLLFQLYAFVLAHTDYDEATENIKYRVFEVEGIPMSEVKKDNEI